MGVYPFCVHLLRCSRGRTRVGARGEEEEEEEEEEGKEESKAPSLSIKSRFNSEPTLKKRVTCKEERQVFTFPSLEPWIKKRRINL